MSSVILDIEVYDKEKATKEHGWGKAQFSFYEATDEQYDTLVKVLIKAIETVEKRKNVDKENRLIGTDIGRRFEATKDSQVE